MASPLVDLDGHVCTITLNRPQALNAFNPAQVQGFSDACVRFPRRPGPLGGRHHRRRRPRLLRRRRHQRAAPPDDPRPRQAPGPHAPHHHARHVHPQAHHRRGQRRRPGRRHGGRARLRSAHRLDARPLRPARNQPRPPSLAGAVPSGCRARSRPPGRWKLLLTGDPIECSHGPADRPRQRRRRCPDALLPTAYDFAARICAKAPLAVQASKEAALRGLQMPLAEGLELERLLFQSLAYTDDIQEGVAAFVAKRPPAFSGS